MKPIVYPNGVKILEKSYLKIADFIRYITDGVKIQTLAFTATATPKIKVDIIDKLKIENPFVFVDNFNRDNIYFKVIDNTGLDKDLDIDSKPFIIDYLRKNKVNLDNILFYQKKCR